MGRLARTLAPKLEGAGHRVTRWRRGDPAPRASLCWITASDDAVAEIAAWLPRGPVVLHASGGLSHLLLRPHRPAGSLHPLQTFPGPEHRIPNLEGIPAAVAGDAEAVAQARDLATSLGMSPFEVTGDRRLYHAACVLAGNFTTVLLAEAARLLTSAGCDAVDPIATLEPLVRASLENTKTLGARNALTGPAARGDHATVQAHLQALAHTHPELQPLYEALTARARALGETEPRS